MKLKELSAKSEVSIELTVDDAHIQKIEWLSHRYGYGQCLLTNYDQTEKRLKLPKSLYEKGYHKVVTTTGKKGKIIIYVFKRGKHARKFLYDFTYLKLETFIGYNELPYETFSGEKAHQLMKQGKIMKLDGSIYCITEDVLYIKTTYEKEWRKAKKKHLDRIDWIEYLAD